MQHIKNIIFDLGGVLLNVDYHKTSRAFKNLGFSNFDELYSQFTANDLFEKLETGSISEDDFYQALMHYHPAITPEQIKIAWNTMLLDFRPASLDFLESLKGKYRLFLLSNTNSIHHTAFKSIFVQETGRESIDAYFEKAYYSHLIGKRKPYADTYQFILQDGGMLPEETLFIDDSINNIEGAIGTGIQTHHLKDSERIEDLPL